MSGESSKLRDAEKEEKPPLPSCRKLISKVKGEAVTSSNKGKEVAVEELVDDYYETTSLLSTYTCDFCFKTFPSAKSLHGHMRSHPDRPYRGMLPPKKSNSPTRIRSDDQVAVKGSSDSDGSNVFPCWPPIPKRRRSGGGTGVSDEDELMLGAVHGLMLLATGDERYRTLPRIRVSEVSPPSKKKVRFDDQRPAEKKRKRENGDEKVYKCSICDKCFGTHQALGGHTSSAHPVKIEQVSNGEGRRGASCDPSPGHQRDQSSKVAGAGHVCETCGVEFSSGQALGGHKRLHYIKPPQPADGADCKAHIVASVVADEAVVRCFDLNEVPADDC